MAYVFHNFILVARRDELLRDGERVELGPKPLAILKYLIEHRGRSVTKQELLDNIWYDVVVSESALHSQLSELRTALGQKRSDTHPIRTLYGVGYCFDCVVSVTEDEIVDKPETRPTSSIPSSPPSEPFVGRQQVIRRLRKALDQTESGESQFFLLEGDAGIGKTRTAMELSDLARQRGIRVHRGRCIDQDGAPAFLPWYGALKGAVSELGPGVLKSIDKRSLSQLALIVPDLAARLGDSFEPAETDTMETSARVYQTITRLLISASELSTSLVILDDLHWADTASLELAAFLASQLLEGRLLIIGTLRDTELAMEHPNRKSLGALLGSRVCQRIQLAGLRQQEVGQYLTQVSRGPVPESLVTAVFERTSGNPFFMREAVRLLVARDDSSDLANVGSLDIEIPEAALGVVRSRLDKIDPDSRKLLEVASVIGRSFDLSLLQHLFHPESGEVLSRLEAAERSGLVNGEREIGRYEFSHDLIAEVLYGGLSSEERARLHRRVAEVLESNPSGQLGINELAHHFHQALPEGQYEKAIRYALQAASQATKMLAHQEAASHLQRAVRALEFDPRPDPGQQCDLLSAQAFALGKAGLRRQARLVGDRACDIARQNGLIDRLIQTRILSRYSLIMAQVPDPAVLDDLEYALGALPPDAVKERCRVLAYLAWLHPNSLDMDRSQKLSSQALELAYQVEDPEVLLDALAARAYSHTGPDRLDELVGITEEMLDLIARRRTFHWSMIDIYMIRLHAFIQLGDLAGVEATLEDWRRTALEFGIEWARERVERLRVQIFLFLRGHFDEAESRFRELDEGSIQARPEGAEFRSGFRTSIRRAMQGTITAEDLEDEPALRFPWLRELHNYRSHRAFLALAAGQIEKATRAFEKLAKNQFADIPKDRAYISTLVDLVRIAVPLEDRQRGQTLYQLLKPYSHINATSTIINSVGSVSHFLGELARLLGKRKQAAEHFEDALVMNQKLELPVALALTRHSYGRLLAEEPSKEARARSRELLAAARETGRQLGIRWTMD